MDLNEIVRRVRESKVLTQENLAEEIGVHVTTMNRYESRGAKIPMDKLEKIAEALKITVSDLYAFKQNPSLLEEPLTFYRTKKKQLSIIVHLDGTPDTLNDWLTTLKQINLALIVN
ncbi:MAG: helix-turn-helix domain-containing protein [Shewanella sp.]